MRYSDSPKLKNPFNLADYHWIIMGRWMKIPGSQATNKRGGFTEYHKVEAAYFETRDWTAHV